MRSINTGLSFALISGVLLCLLGVARAADISAVSNGNWSSGAVWSSGSVPATEDVAIIPTGIEINYDMYNPTINVSTVNIQGGATLNVSSLLAGQTLLLTISGNMIVTGNLVVAGTANIKFYSESSLGSSDPIMHKIQVDAPGLLLVSGNFKTIEASLNASVVAGGTSLSLIEAPEAWQTGDILYMVDLNTSGNQEYVTVNSVAGQTVGLLAGLAKSYLSDSSKILNLSRSILIGSISNSETQNIYISTGVDVTVDVQFAEMAYLGSVEQATSPAGFQLASSKINRFASNAIHHSAYSVYFNNGDYANSLFENNIVYQERYSGFYGYSSTTRPAILSHNFIVDGCTANGYGIYLATTGNTVASNTLIKLTVKNAIHLVNSANIVADNILNNIQGANGNGIYSTTGGDTIARNTLQFCNNGVMLFSPSNAVTGNTIAHTRSRGIYLYGYDKDFNLIQDNVITSCNNEGMDIVFSKLNTVSGNILRNIQSIAINLNTDSSRNMIAGNDISSCNSYGIFMAAGENSVSQNRFVATNQTAVYAYTTAPSNTIVDCILSSYNQQGIYILSNGNLVSGNTLTNFTDKGILLYGTSAYGNQIIGNQISSMNDSCIYLSDAPSNSIVGNTLEHTTAYGIYIASASATNNLVEGNNITWTGSSAIIVASAMGNRILNNTCTSMNSYGIFISGTPSSYNLIEGNTIVSANNYGISLPGPYNTVSGNIIRKIRSYGVYLNGANSCNVENNLISSINRVSGTTPYGIYNTSAINTLISGNSIDCTHGIYINASIVTLNNNTVTGQGSDASGAYGFSIVSSTANGFGNTIYNYYYGIHVQGSTVTLTDNVCTGNYSLDVYGPTSSTASNNMTFYNSLFSDAGISYTNGPLWSYFHNQTPGKTYYAGVSVYNDTQPLSFTYESPSYPGASDSNLPKIFALGGFLTIASNSGLLVSGITGNRSTISGSSGDNGLNIYGGVTLNHVNVEYFYAYAAPSNYGFNINKETAAGISLQNLSFANMRASSDTTVMDMPFPQLIFTAPIAITFDGAISFDVGGWVSQDVSVNGARVVFLNATRGTKSDSVVGTGAVIWLPPTANQFVLASGGTGTSELNPTFTFYIENNVDYYEISGDIVGSPVTRAAYDVSSSYYPLTLNVSQLGSTLTLYSTAKSNLGYASQTATLTVAYIWIPTQATLLINGGESMTRNVSANIQVSVSGNDTPQNLRIGQGGLNPLGQNTDSGLVSYSSLIYFDLESQSTEGTRTVEVAFFVTGNTQSATFSSSVIFDATAPTAPTIAISSQSGLNSIFTSNNAVLFTHRAIDTYPGSYAFGGDVVGSPVASFNTSNQSVTTNVSMTTAEGSKNVILYAYDQAGNAGTASIEVVYDITPPTGSAYFFDNSPTTDLFTLTLNLNVSDNYNASQDMLIQLIPQNGSISGVTQNAFFAFQSPLTLSVSGVGYGTTLDVLINVKDMASNMGTLNAAIGYFNTTPVPGRALIDGDFAATADYVLTLNYIAYDDNFSFVSITGDIINSGITYSYTSSGVTASQRITLNNSSEGSKSIGVMFTDLDNNSTQSVVTIIFDATAPTLTSFAIEGTPVTLNHPTFNLRIVASDNVTATENLFVYMSFEGASGLSVTTDATANFAENLETYALNATHNMSVTVSLAIIDMAGNRSATQSVGLIYINTAPRIVSYTVGNGSGYITSTTTLSVTATDDEDNLGTLVILIDNQVNTYSNAFNSGYTSLPVLTTGNLNRGHITASITVADSFNSTVSVLDIPVTFDANAPTGSMQIADGVNTVNRSLVSLNLTITDDIGNSDNVWVKFSSSASTLTLATADVYVPFAPTFEVNLNLASGMSTVLMAIFRDPAGRESAPVTVMAILSNEGATQLMSTLNHGALITSQNIVTMAVQALDSDGATVIFDGDISPTFSYSYTSTSAASLEVTANLISETQGTKNVRVTFVDSAGNESVTTSYVIYDTMGPTLNGVTLGDGSGSLYSNVVTFNVNVQDANYSGSEIWILLSFEDISPTGIVTADTYILLNDFQVTMFVGLQSDDRVTVSVTAMDGIGNLSTALVTSAVMVLSDRGPTQAMLALRGGVAYTNSAVITATYSADDDDLYYAAFSGSLASSVTYSYTIPGAQTSALTLSSTYEGVKTIVLTIGDAQDSRTETSDYIIYDRTAPTGSLQVASGSPTLNQITIDIYVDALDNFSASADMAVKFSVIPSTAVSGGVTLDSYIAYSEIYSGVTLNIATGDSLSWLVCLRDGAGNESTCNTVSVVYDPTYIDTEAPTATVITNNSGLAYTTTSNIWLNFSAQSGFTRVNVSGDIAYGSKIITSMFSNAEITLLDDYRETKNLQITFEDAAGNRSAQQTFSIPYRPKLFLAGGRSQTAHPWISVELIGMDLAEGYGMYVSGDVEEALGLSINQWIGVSTSYRIKLSNAAVSGNKTLIVYATVATMSATVLYTSNTDSDSDGMSDAWESANGLNPNDASDGGRADRDGDGLPNLKEFWYGSNPTSFSDSDGDGLSDDWETMLGTNPNRADSSLDNDHDDYTNIEELANGTHPMIGNGAVPLLQIGGYSNSGAVDLLVTANAAATVTGTADPGHAVRLYSKFSSHLYPSALESAGTLVQESTVTGDGAFALSLNVPADGGLYAYTVVVENAAGDLNTQMLQVFVDSGAPQISLVTLGGDFYYSGMIVTPSALMEAMVTDDVQVVSISLVVDSGSSIDIMASGNTSVSYNSSTGYMSYTGLSLSAGRHTLVLSATDTSNFTAQATLLVEVSDGTLRMTHGPLVYPNPINGSSARFAYGLSEPANIRLRVYNINGELVWDTEFSSGTLGGKVGYNEVSWDGKNGWGESLGNGVYIGVFSSGNTYLGRVKIAVYR